MGLDCIKLGDMRMAGFVAAGLLGAAVLFGAMGAPAAMGQSAGFMPRKDAAEIPSYELISIHKNKDAKEEGGIHEDPDGMRADATSLRSLIGEAYGFSLGQLSDQMLIGAPSWAKTQMFDVHGKVESADVEKLKALTDAETMMVFAQDLASRTPTVRMVMLQRLLEDRFHLKAHYEQRVMPLYEMTVAKGGVRMKIAHPANPEHGSMGMSDGMFKGENVPISFIPAILPLASDIERPVVDKTDTAGNYDFEMHWSRMGDTADNGAGAAGPSLFTAIQEQLGLKLNPSKGPVWVIVVDHAEMPSEN
jgi:uncharacterized protein (TIGR03435 family)